MPLDKADLLAAFSLLQIGGGSHNSPQPALPVGPKIDIRSQFANTLKIIAGCEDWFASIIMRNVMVMDHALQGALSKIMVAAKDLTAWMERVEKLNQVIAEIKLNYPANQSVAWQVTTKHVTATLDAIRSRDNDCEKIVQSMSAVGHALTTYVDGTDTWAKCWKLAEPIWFGLQEQQRGPGTLTQRFHDARVDVLAWQERVTAQEGISTELRESICKVLQFLEVAEVCWAVMIE